MSDIDWRAVNFTVRGTRMVSLNRDEKSMVIRRIRLLAYEESSDYPPPGSLKVETVAYRLGINERQVQRIAKALPAATERRCPICGSRAWIHNDTKLVEDHPDSLTNECPLSGHVLTELDHLDMVMIRAQWLRQWLAAGDVHGVAAYLSGLSDVDRQEVTLAALYTEEEVAA